MPIETDKLILWTNLLRHTLGVREGVRKSDYGYRNRFCVSVGSADDLVFQEMVVAGLAEEGDAINNGKARYYRATLEGCKVVGLSKAAIKRAFED